MRLLHRRCLAIRQQLITSTVLALAVGGNMPDRRVKLFEGAGKFSIAR
jgi:hypothetical protein